MSQTPESCVPGLEVLRETTEVYTVLKFESHKFKGVWK